jgi:hypothetical protein
MHFSSNIYSNSTVYYIVPAGAEGETAASIKARAVEAEPKEKNALSEFTCFCQSSKYLNCIVFYIVPAGAEGETASAVKPRAADAEKNALSKSTFSIFSSKI